ncbi:MAG: hypothetical protein KC550_00210 [Nanoarchaeota archaeon]|nr:hypothetical protein [Nanoarchaeota archaeon]
MNIKFFSIFPLISIFLLIILGCTNITENEPNSCQMACNRIMASENAPQFDTSQEITMYYGNLNEKRVGTPSNWVHILEGTKSSQWRKAESEKNLECDCISQIEQSEFPQCEIDYIKTGECDESKCDLEYRDIDCSFYDDDVLVEPTCKQIYCDVKE